MPDEEQSGTERFLLPGLGRGAVDDWLDTILRARLGSGVDQVIFRAGRIDAVFGLRLVDGREVLLKVHRPPVDVPALTATVEAQRVLASAGYPCAVTLDGPVTSDGHVITVESLLTQGARPDASRPEVRRAMIAGLLSHIELLRSSESAAIRFGAGPAWTQFQHGPWPVPHDTIFDFAVTPDGYDWLDDFAREAADELNAYRSAAPPVLGHADWYAGNLLFEGGQLSGVFDWDLVRQHEPMVIGFSAAYYHADRPSTPAEIKVFLDDVDTLRPAPFTPVERRAATAAARWVMAFNARCDLTMLAGDVDPRSSLGLLRDDRDAYCSIGA